MKEIRLYICGGIFICAVVMFFTRDYGTGFFMLGISLLFILITLVADYYDRR